MTYSVSKKVTNRILLEPCMFTSILANKTAGASLLYGFYSRLIVEDVPRNGSGQPSPDLTALNLAILKVFKSFQLIDRVPN